MKTTKSVIRQPLGEFHGIRAEIVNHQVWDVPANALALYFPEVRNTLSGRQGFKRAKSVFNCHLPESLWPSFHEKHSNWLRYFKELLRETLPSPDIPPDKTVFLSTGVNMEHLSWAEEIDEQLWVLAFVTAGVKTNAMRIGKDRANDVKRNGQATINVILLTNASLSSAALAASFITITEAKVVALQELDIRSSYNPGWQATGTGTDQIVVVSGREDKCTYVGGHAKIGELMARAVTSATVDAIKKNLGVLG